MWRYNLVKHTREDISALVAKLETQVEEKGEQLMTDALEMFKNDSNVQRKIVLLLWLK